MLKKMCKLQQKVSLEGNAYTEMHLLEKKETRKLMTQLSISLSHKDNTKLNKVEGKK